MRLNLDRKKTPYFPSLVDLQSSPLLKVSAVRVLPSEMKVSSYLEQLETAKLDPDDSSAVLNLVGKGELTGDSQLIITNPSCFRLGGKLYYSARIEPPDNEFGTDTIIYELKSETELNLQSDLTENFTIVAFVPGLQDPRPVKYAVQEKSSLRFSTRLLLYGVAIDPVRKNYRSVFYEMEAKEKGLQIAKKPVVSGPPGQKGLVIVPLLAPDANEKGSPNPSGFLNKLYMRERVEKWRAGRKVVLAYDHALYFNELKELTPKSLAELISKRKNIEARYAQGEWGGRQSGELIHADWANREFVLVHDVHLARFDRATNTKIMKAPDWKKWGGQLKDSYKLPARVPGMVVDLVNDVGRNSLVRRLRQLITGKPERITLQKVLNRLTRVSKLELPSFNNLNLPREYSSGLLTSLYKVDEKGQVRHVASQVYPLLRTKDLAGIDPILAAKEPKKMKLENDLLNVHYLGAGVIEEEDLKPVPHDLTAPEKHSSVKIRRRQPSGLRDRHSFEIISEVDLGNLIRDLKELNR